RSATPVSPSCPWWSSPPRSWCRGWVALRSTIPARASTPRSPARCWAGAGSRCAVRSGRGPARRDRPRDAGRELDHAAPERGALLRQAAAALLADRAVVPAVGAHRARGAAGAAPGRAAGGGCHHAARRAPPGTRGWRPRRRGAALLRALRRVRALPAARDAARGRDPVGVYRVAVGAVLGGGPAPVGRGGAGVRGAGGGGARQGPARAGGAAGRGGDRALAGRAAATRRVVAARGRGRADARDRGRLVRDGDGARALVPLVHGGGQPRAERGADARLPRRGRAALGAGVPHRGRLRRRSVDRGRGG